MTAQKYLILTAFLLAAVPAVAEVETRCAHQLQQVGSNYFSQAQFELGKGVVVAAFGELAEGSYWFPARAELQDLQGNWIARVGNVQVIVDKGTYASNQYWIPEKIGPDTSSFESTFGRYPAVRCALLN